MSDVFERVIACEHNLRATVDVLNAAKEAHARQSRDLGKALREMRVDRGMILSDIAEVTGYTVVHLSDMERGRKPIVDVDRLQRWIDRLEVGA